MTTVVQTVVKTGPSILNNVPSWTFTLAATTVGNLLAIEVATQTAGGGAASAYVVTDNGTGNTWQVAVFKAGTAGDNRTAAILYCIPVSSVTSVTVTPTATQTSYGVSAIHEVSGTGTWSVDQTGSGVSSGTTLTVTSGGVDIGTADFVGAAFSCGTGSPTTGITDPPTGYTSAAVNQDDSSSSGAEVCFRINSGAVTDSVTWNYTGSVTGEPGVIASFKLTAGASAPFVPPPQLSAPAPKSQIGYASVACNLLLTTLAVAAAAIPAGEQLFSSAPQARVYRQNSCEQKPGSPLPLGLTTLFPNAVGLSASAPAIRYAVNVPLPPNLLDSTLSAPALLPNVSEQSFDGALKATRRIGPVDASQYPLTLGLTTIRPNALGQIASAPVAKAAVEVDVYPNLLGTTLAPVAGVTASFREPLIGSQKPKAPIGGVDAPPNLLGTTLASAATLLPNLVEQLFDSVKTVARLGAVDPPQYPPALLAQTPLLPSLSEQSFDSTKSRARIGAVDATQYPLTLGIPDPVVLPALAGNDVYPLASRALIGTPDALPNLLETTLASAVQPPGNQAFEGAPKARYEVRSDIAPYSLTLGLVTLRPNTAQLSASAPAVKYFPQDDVYPNRVLFTQVLNVPPVLQLIASAPAVKSAVIADQYPNPLVRGIFVDVLLPSLAGAWSDSAPIARWQIRSDAPVNSALLAPSAAVLPPGHQLNDGVKSTSVIGDPDIAYPLTLVVTVQPLGRQWFESAPARRFAVTFDLPQNILPRGINPVPAIMRWSESAPITKYRIELDTPQRPVTLGIQAPPSLVGLPHYLIRPAFERRIVSSAYEQRIITQRFAMQTGPLPYAEFYTRVGDKNTYGIDWADWLANRWVRGSLVTLGFTIRPTIPTGYQLLCTTAGESGAIEPVVTSIGATVNDGSVVWTCEAFDTTSLAETVASAEWAAPTGVTIGAQSLVGQIASAFIDLTGTTAGVDYLVECSATMTDGEVKVGQFKFKVR